MITSLIVETYKDGGKLNLHQEFNNVLIPVYETDEIIEHIRTVVPSTKKGDFVFKAFDSYTNSLNQRLVKNLD